MRCLTYRRSGHRVRFCKELRRQAPQLHHNCHLRQHHDLRLRLHPHLRRARLRPHLRRWCPWRSEIRTHAPKRTQCSSPTPKTSLGMPAIGSLAPWSLGRNASTEGAGVCDIPELLTRELRLRRGEVSVMLHQPEPYLIRFENAERARQARGHGRFTGSGIDIYVCPWYNLTDAFAF